MMPAWGSLLQGLRSGKVPWAEAHPAEAAAGRDFWSYLEVWHRGLGYTLMLV